MLTIASALAQRGHGVTLAGRPGSRFLARAAGIGLATQELAVRGDADPRTLRELRRLYGREGIDAVIANFNKDVRLAGLARLPGRRPRVLARNGLAILPDDVRYRLTYRRLADGIITNTESIRRRYLDYGWVPPGFVHVIPNGIEPPASDPRSSAEVRAALGLPVAGRWIGGFGRMVTQKRFDLLLAAAARNVAEIEDLRVLLVGDGPEVPTLAAEARRLGIDDRLTQVGFQSSVWDWIRAVDVVVLSSASEGLPNAVLEAMALGRAVAAFDVGGVRELLPDDGVGRVVPAGNVDGLAAAVGGLIADPAQRTELAARAAARVRAEFSLGVMTDRVEALLSGLIDGAG